MRSHWFRVVWAVLMLCAAALPASAQGGKAAKLFQELAVSELDPQKVLHIRDCDIDLEDLHITLEEGTIAFLKDDVNGRPTGALFAGEGSVLAIPPNQVERASLARFTKSAVLNERIQWAYLRFYDEQTYAALKAALRSPEPEAAAFVRDWGTLAKNLAQHDALRLTMLELNKEPTRFVHARFTSSRLGVFDAVYDGLAPESILVAQAGHFAGADFEDVWLSFPSRSQRAKGQTERSASAGELAHTNQLQADQNGVHSEVDIEHYALDVQVSPPTDIAATVDLTMLNSERPVSAVLFQLSHRLKVSSVELDGAPVEFLQNPPIPGSVISRSGNDLIAVSFGAPLAPKSKHTVRFKYAGSVMTDTGGGLLYVGDRGTWYPNFGFRNAMFDLRYTVPQGWTLVSTGKRVAREQALHFATEKPVPVAGFNVGRFTESRASSASGSVTISAFEAGHSDAGGSVSPEEMARRSSQSIAFLERHVGPFPYSELSVSEVPGGVSQGWPGLVFLSTQAFTVPKLGAQPRSEFARIVFEDLMLPHEIGHQYWGDNVAWRSYREQWIMEALTNYCALMQLQEAHTEELPDVLEHYRRSLLQPWTPNAPVTLGQRLDSSQSPNGYTLLTYGRGTWLIHMLRCLFRDAEKLHGNTLDPEARFWSALEDLQKRFAGRAIGEDDLQQTFEKALPSSLSRQGSSSLSWFFSDWVNGASLPHFEIKELKMSGATASGTIVRSEAPRDFTAVLPLYAESASGAHTLVAQVFADDAEEPFTVKVPAGTVRVVLDPEHEVLRRD